MAVMMRVAFIVVMLMKMEATGAFVVAMRFMMIVVVVVIMREVNIKFHAGDGGFLPARDVQMIAVELELLQFALQLLRIHAEVEQRGDKHVARDTAKNIEIKGFHFISEGRVIRGPKCQGLVELVPPASALISLAA